MIYCYFIAKQSAVLSFSSTGISVDQSDLALCKKSLFVKSQLVTSVNILSRLYTGRDEIAPLLIRGTVSLHND